MCVKESDFFYFPTAGKHYFLRSRKLICFPLTQQESNNKKYLKRSSGSFVPEFRSARNWKRSPGLIVLRLNRATVLHAWRNVKIFTDTLRHCAESTDQEV